MAPSEYAFRLQKGTHFFRVAGCFTETFIAGITGGFAPPTPSAVHTFSKSGPASHIAIESLVRPDGTPELQSHPSKSLSFSPSSDSGSDELSGLISELRSILKELPTEQPPGSEDIYGLDTSIMWADDELQWVNGGPQGCSGGPGSSSVQATKEEKEKFTRAVGIVEELLKRAG